MGSRKLLPDEDEAAAERRPVLRIKQKGTTFVMPSYLVRPMRLERTTFRVGV